MIESLDLSLHEAYIHSLVLKTTLPEQDRDDLYQDFCLYFYQYANKFDPEKGKPTTFIKSIFRNFMSNRNRTEVRHKPLNEATHIEERDKEYLDREQGGYESAVEDEVFINELLSDIDKVTLSLLTGDVTYAEQAQEEGISIQRVHKRHQDRMKKITGE